MAHRISWVLRNEDYDSRMGFHVAVQRLGDESLPTNGDMLDIIINVVARRIRRGELKGSLIAGDSLGKTDYGEGSAIDEYERSRDALGD